MVLIGWFCQDILQSVELFVENIALCPLPDYNETDGKRFLFEALPRAVMPGQCGAPHTARPEHIAWVRPGFL